MSHVSIRRGGHEFRQIFAHLKTNDDDDRSDEYWRPLLDSHHECLSIGYWLSQYSRDHNMNRLDIVLRASGDREFQLALEAYIHNLYLLLNSHEENADVTLGDRLTEGPRGRLSGFDDEMPPVRAYNERLHSRWAMLCHAIGGSRSWSKISIADIELPDALLNLLAKSLSRRKSVYEMILANNGISRDGVKTVSRIIGGNSCLTKLSLGDIELNYLGAAIDLAKGIKASKQLVRLALINCGIGANSRIVSTILNSCHDVRFLHLCGKNGFRGRSVDVMAQFLMSNPKTEILVLRNNQLSDDNAVPLAQSLKSNTNLQMLYLEGNDLTKVGIDTMLSSVFDERSLNALSDCNRTCRLHPGIHNRRFALVQFKKKLIYALCTTPQHGCVNMHYLNDVPLECMPQVLTLIQKSAKELLLSSKFTLSIIFEVMRKWEVPSLYYYRSSKWRHPKEVALCVDNLVSSIANDGICGFDYHSAHLPKLLPSEYEVIIPVTSQARSFNRHGRSQFGSGLSISVGGCSSGPVLFLEHHRLKDDSKSTPEFFNLMQLGDVITGVNGMSTNNVSFDEVISMLKASRTFTYLRLERSKHYNRGEYPRNIDLFEYV